MRTSGWESSRITKSLREQIEAYVKEITRLNVPQIPFEGYRKFMEQGSRRESEEAYFNTRKQLTAMGLYLMWKKPSETEQDYFNELLWSVSNEFTWCLAAHIPYEEKYIPEAAAGHIDLFAAETAATLSELITIHPDIIHPAILVHIRRQIDSRVLTPFLTKDWHWETSRSNWCAVCAGNVGMAALMLEQGERQKKILDKVDRALVHYLDGFGEDGATEEGVGYWAYGFGYYIYYTALRQEMDSGYQLPGGIREKVRKIAEFPYYVQIAEHAYVPFSDAAAGIVIPTGLLSCLQKEYGIDPPECGSITPFDFDHCYRFAHISRNLWWTREQVFNRKGKDFIHYFPDKQWLVQRKGSVFFAVKGGNNAEDHNHNDVGSFILAIGGELILTDLGAGIYTADYFGSNRYQSMHTRSYWHNLPLIDREEQVPTPNGCEIKEVFIDGSRAELRMELSKLYDIRGLNSFTRSFISEPGKDRLVLRDEFISVQTMGNKKGTEGLSIEEGFISLIKPVINEDGVIIWEGRAGKAELRYDTALFSASLEEAEAAGHLGEKGTAYRVGLSSRKPAHKHEAEFEIKIIIEE